MKVRLCLCLFSCCCFVLGMGGEGDTRSPGLLPMFPEVRAMGDVVVSVSLRLLSSVAVRLVRHACVL